MQNFELSSELFAALIGVGIALLLGAVGWVINATNDTRKWKRQQRFELYLAMVGLQRKLRTELDHMLSEGQKAFDSTDPAAKTEFSKQSRRHGHNALALFDELEEQSTIIDIVGTQRLVKRHHAYKYWTVHYIEKNAYVQMNPHNEDNKYLHLWNATHRTAWRYLLEQAQTDLGFRNRWKRSSIKDKDLRRAGLRKPRESSKKKSDNKPKHSR